MAFPPQGQTSERVTRQTEPFSVVAIPESQQVLDEAGGDLQARVALTDRDDAKISSSNIDISSISVTVADASGSTTGITQPSTSDWSKSDGLIKATYNLTGSEWSDGDVGYYELDGATVTIDGDTFEIGVVQWTFIVTRYGNLHSDVDDLHSTRVGSVSDSAVDPCGSSGSLHAKTRGLANDIGDASGDTSLSSLTAKLGDDGDSASVGSGSLHARLAALEAALGIVSGGAGSGFEADGAPSLYDRVAGDSDALLTRVGDPTGGTDSDLAARLGDPSGSPTASASGNIAQRLEEVLANRADVATSTRSNHADPDPNSRIDNLAWTRNTGTHSHSSNTNEQDVLENTGISDPTQVVIVLDLGENLTEDHTIRVKEKVDGTNYTSIDPAKSWTSTDEDGVRISFTASDDYKVTLQSSTAEGSSNDVAFIHSNRPQPN